ncbi:hypothetical protein AB0H73_30825 [Streptomyces olivoreticuli]
MSLIVIALIAAACYGLVCVCSPFGRCRKCHGLGFATKTDRKSRPRRGRPCRRCDGHGIRIRTGRNLWARTYRKGTR